LHLLYHHFGTSFKSHHKIRPNIFNYTPLKTVHNLPDNTNPVDTTDITARWQTSPITLTAHPNNTVAFHFNFITYVNKLPGQEVMLLQSVNFLCPNPHQLHITLSQADNLLLVRDGDADNIIGSTGWIMANPLGNYLVKGSSSFPGVNPRSYQAEGYAMSSGLTFY
jgi:hypothetical protein